MLGFRDLRGSDKAEVKYRARIPVAGNFTNNIVLMNSANDYHFRLADVRRIFSVEVVFSIVSWCRLISAFEVANKVAHMGISDAQSYLFHAKQTIFQKFSSNFQSGFDQAFLQTDTSLRFEQMA